MIDASVFSDWANFYVVIGTAAATLTGLMFVTVTLIARLRDPDLNAATSTFGTPTIVHFSTALLVSAILSAPWRSVAYAAWILAIIGLCGVVYASVIIYRSRRQTAYTQDLEDWMWFNVLPLLAYLAIAAGGFMLAGSNDSALFAFAGAALLLIFIGIHNAWDSVTYLAVTRFPPQDSDEGP